MPSTLRQSLLAFLNIPPGEGRLVTLVLLYAILLYTANVLIHTASYALFLAEFGAAALPYTFVGVAVFASLVSFVQLKVNEHFSLATGLIAAQIFLLLSLAAYWLGLFAAAPWLIFSLPIYYRVNTRPTLRSFWLLVALLPRFEER